MSQQLKSVITWSDADGDPNSNVNAARLTSHVVDATLTNAAVTDQLETASPADTDSVLIGDSVAGPAAAPRRCQIGKLRVTAQQYGGDTGAANTYLVTLDPPATAFYAGMLVRFKALHANTGASTVNVNGLGAKPIVTTSSGPLAANQILTNQMVELEFDGISFQLKNPSQSAVAAAVFAVDTGTVNTFAVALNPAPEGYYPGMVVQFKALVTNTGASTISVNGMTSKAIKRRDGAALLNREIVAGQIVTIVYDGTNFQLMHSAQSWDFISALTAVPVSPTFFVAIPHGLAGIPSRVRVVMVQFDSAAQNGYSQFDEVELWAFSQQVTPVGLEYAFSTDATNVTVSSVNSANVYVLTKGGSTTVTTTLSKWRVKVYAAL